MLDVRAVSAFGMGENEVRAAVRALWIKDAAVGVDLQHEDAALGVYAKITSRVP